MRTRAALAFLLIAFAVALRNAPAAETKGHFQFGKTKFDVVDTLAFVQTEGFSEPITVIAMADFRIDRKEVMEALDVSSALFAQVIAQEKGNFLFVHLLPPDRCEVTAILSTPSQQAGLATAAATIKRTKTGVAGVCFTEKPGKMFADSYEYRLPFDVAITDIPKPTKLGDGGGEPGRALVSLVKAIQSNDWNTAKLHLRQEEVATTPKPDELKDFFHGLALNYPKTAAATGGLLKGDRAQIDIRGTDLDGRKLEGYFTMRKIGSDWRVIEQYLHYAE